MIYLNPDSFHILYLLLPLLFFIIWTKKKLSFKVSSLQRVESNLRWKKYLVYIPLLLYLIAFTLLIFAWARPVNTFNSSYEEGIDIVVILDVSESMEFYDYNQKEFASYVLQDILEKGKKSRLDIAKETLIKFIQLRKNDRVGLVVFSGEAFLLSPPTLEHDYLIERVKTINNIDWYDLPRSTNITAALSRGIKQALLTESKEKVIIFFTDGSHSEGVSPYPPMTAVNLLKEKKIKVHSVGIGGKYTYRVEKNTFGDPVYALLIPPHLNEDFLKDMAKKTGGQYFKAEDSASFSKVLREIDEIEKHKIKTKNFSLKEELFMSFLIYSFIVFLLASIMDYCLFRVYPR